MQLSCCLHLCSTRQLLQGPHHTPALPSQNSHTHFGEKKKKKCFIVAASSARLLPAPRLRVWFLGQQCCGAQQGQLQSASTWPGAGAPAPPRSPPCLPPSPRQGAAAHYRVCEYIFTTAGPEGLFNNFPCMCC